jgi:hypothetical protein
MRLNEREIPALELFLLRRSVAGLAERSERCGHCHRTMLIGEKVYEYGSGQLRCELCKKDEHSAPAHSHLIHTPEFGHTIKVIDQRGTQAPAATA